MLILNDDLPVITVFLRDGVAAFRGENPGCQPVCVALHASPASGWVSVCVDARDHDVGPLIHCPDFSHPEYRSLERPAWAMVIRSAHPVVQRHDMGVVRWVSGDGDDAFNEAVFHMLMKVSNDYYHRDSAVYRPKWSGVQIADSRWASFWRVHGHPEAT